MAPHDPSSAQNPSAQNRLLRLNTTLLTVNNRTQRPHHKPLSRRVVQLKHRRVWRRRFHARPHRQDQARRRGPLERNGANAEHHDRLETVLRPRAIHTARDIDRKRQREAGLRE